jgi:ligand-binding sensor domain-containing protein
MWVSTSKGIAYYDGFQWLALDSSDGIPQFPQYSLNYFKDEKILATDNKIHFRNFV